MTDHDTWTAADTATRERICAALASADLRFTGLDGDLAHFAWRDVALVLVPGREAQLGWARSRLALTDEQRRSWQDGMAAHWGFDGPAEELFAENASASRRVQLPSLLVQAELLPVDLDELLYDEDGDELDVEPIAALAASLGEGFRLPTADEWEYLYRAGATTVFPWGDAWPERSSYGAGPVARDPNAFGLRFDYDTYWSEVIASGLRGGDGGSDACGGLPDPVDWRSLACAYVPDPSLWTDILEISLEQAYVRRVRTVSL